MINQGELAVCGCRRVCVCVDVSVCVCEQGEWGSGIQAAR